MARCIDWKIRFLEWLSKRRIPNAISVFMTYVCYGWAVLISFTSTLLQLAEMPTGDARGLYAEFLKLVVSHRLLIYVGISIAMVVFVFLKWIAKIAAPPCNQAVLQNVLVEAVSAISESGDSPDRLSFRYRATLFKFREPWRLVRWIVGARWAGVVARSDDTYRTSNSVFLIDDADPANSTGLVGLCHRSEGGTFYWSLPDPHDSLSEYAARSNIPESEVELLKIKPRSCLVTGVKRRDGSFWGAIIFDTQDPRALSSTQQQNSSKRIFRLLSAAVSELIQ